MESMTVFYSKRTGEIKSVCMWETSFEEYLPTTYEDYQLIWGCVRLPQDEYVFQHQDLMKFDTKLNRIVFKEGISPRKYLQ
ncbi:hypothetical protein P4J60_20945 [Bacillus cereus]|nr:hypothetical protein [Bacillus cereus]MEB9569683.1 hypothetical protein [Bacillus cereus]